MLAHYTVTESSLAKHMKRWEETANLGAADRTGRPTLLDSPMAKDLRAANKGRRGRGQEVVVAGMTLPGGMYRGQQTKHPCANTVRAWKKKVASSGTALCTDC